MLTVTYAECDYAECCHAEHRHAETPLQHYNLNYSLVTFRKGAVSTKLLMIILRLLLMVGALAT